jgi:hypothetical protein
MNDELTMEASDDGPTAWLVIETENLPADTVVFWREREARTHAAVLASRGKDVLLRQIRIQGDRTRCRLCGEPVELVDPFDDLSWIHAPDANDLGDHTADCDGAAA